MIIIFIEYDVILNKAKQLEQKIISYRRQIHQQPELGLKEHNTSQLVVDELNQLDFDKVELIGTNEQIKQELNLLNEPMEKDHGPTGVLATIKGAAGPGPTVLLRADMDALLVGESEQSEHIPVQEGFASKNEGVMHACGHDAHTAMLLGTAHLLSEFKSQLKGTIKLIFQPDEERGCGAKIMCRNEIMNNVDAVFGVHVWKSVNSGQVMIHRGPTMASVDNFWIDVSGGGGHSSRPHETRDPIMVSTELINSIYKIHDRELNSTEPSLLTVEQIQSKADWGVIPSQASMRGTIRTFDEQVRDYIVSRIQELCNMYSDFYDLDCQFHSLNVFPPLNNNEEMAELAEDTVDSLLGTGKIVTESPIMSGEDFAYYLREAPGAFVFLGTYNEDKGITSPHHNPEFDVDEDILYVGSALYLALALNCIDKS